MALRRLVTASLFCALAAGCRGSGSRSGPAAPRVGPDLDRLVAQLRDPALTPEQKETYWRSVRGTLIRPTGIVVEVGQPIAVEVPPAKKRAEKVGILAYPDAANAPALATLRPGQSLAVLGELAARSPGGPPFRDAAILFELRNARLIVR